MAKTSEQNTSEPSVRIDKFLWAARFYKTRKLAQEQISKGRAKINGNTAKASKDIKAGDMLELLLNGHIRTFSIDAISDKRGSATIAQTLYTETDESKKRFESQKEAQRLLSKTLPSNVARYAGKGRPTKRNRRQLDDSKNNWNKRWSAGVE